MHKTMQFAERSLYNRDYHSITMSASRSLLYSFISGGCFDSRKHLHINPRHGWYNVAFSEVVHRWQFN